MKYRMTKTEKEILKSSLKTIINEANTDDYDAEWNNEGIEWIMEGSFEYKGFSFNEFIFSIVIKNGKFYFDTSICFSAYTEVTEKILEEVQDKYSKTVKKVDGMLMNKNYTILNFEKVVKMIYNETVEDFRANLKDEECLSPYIDSNIHSFPQLEIIGGGAGSSTGQRCESEQWEVMWIIDNEIIEVTTVAIELRKECSYCGEKLDDDENCQYLKCSQK